MVTKVTDSVMDLSNVQQDIVLNGQKITGVTDSPTLDDEATSKKYVDDTIATLLEIKVPAGMGPLAWSGSTAPTGWLMCDGASYDSVADTSLEDLFNVIGTTYGGTGANNFNVPDMRGRFPLGLNDSGSGTKRVNRTQAQNLGQNDGQENYKLELGHMPSHDHTLTITQTGSPHIHSGATTDTEPNHDHAITFFNDTDIDGGGGRTSSLVSGSGSSKSTDLDGQHSHNVTVPNTNSGHIHGGSIGFTAANTEHENTPPFLTLNYIIKT
jgi:microcystin-dependent protein